MRHAALCHGGMFLFSHKTKEEQLFNFLQFPHFCGNMHALDIFNLKIGSLSTYIYLSAIRFLKLFIENETKKLRRENKIYI
jgi:hypothetical protein